MINPFCVVSTPGLMPGAVGEAYTPPPPPAISPDKTRAASHL